MGWGWQRADPHWRLPVAGTPETEYSCAEVPGKRGLGSGWCVALFLQKEVIRSRKAMWPSGLTSCQGGSAKGSGLAAGSAPGRRGRGRRLCPWPCPCLCEEQGVRGLARGPGPAALLGAGADLVREPCRQAVTARRRGSGGTGRVCGPFRSRGAGWASPPTCFGAAPRLHRPGPGTQPPAPRRPRNQPARRGGPCHGGPVEKEAARGGGPPF